MVTLTNLRLQVDLKVKCELYQPGKCGVRRAVEGWESRLRSPCVEFLADGRRSRSVRRVGRTSSPPTLSVARTPLGDVRAPAIHARATKRRRAAAARRRARRAE